MAATAKGLWTGRIRQSPSQDAGLATGSLVAKLPQTLLPNPYLKGTGLFEKGPGMLSVAFPESRPGMSEIY